MACTHSEVFFEVVYLAIRTDLLSSYSILKEKQEGATCQCACHENKHLYHKINKVSACRHKVEGRAVALNQDLALVVKVYQSLHK